MFLLTFPIYIYGIYKISKLPIEHTQLYNLFIGVNIVIIALGIIHYCLTIKRYSKMSL